jgi:hypothetical protein
MSQPKTARGRRRGEGEDARELDADLAAHGTLRDAGASASRIG